MTDGKEVPLPEAAAELKKTWGQAWQLILTGVLDGRKKDGKWLVSRDSIRDYQKLEKSGPTPPAAA